MTPLEPQQNSSNKYVEKLNEMNLNKKIDSGYQEIFHVTYTHNILHKCSCQCRLL